MSILHVNKVRTGEVWVAADAESFYAYNLQVYTGKSDGAREKKQGLQVTKDMVCHMYGTRKGVTADNFFTSCELADILLTKNVTVIGMLRKSEPAVPALLLSWKQRRLSFCIWLYQWSITGIICTSKKQGCCLFITASWRHMLEWRKRSQTWTHHSL